MFGEPVGYVFQADIWCPECVRLAFGLAHFSAEAALDAAPWAVTYTRDEWGWVAGFVVRVRPWLARRLRLRKRASRTVTRLFDRYDETAFDSGDFPKIYIGTPHDGCYLDNGYEPGQCGDTCGQCHEPIDGECPNVADEPW